MMVPTFDWPELLVARRSRQRAIAGLVPTFPFLVQGSHGKWEWDALSSRFLFRQLPEASSLGDHDELPVSANLSCVHSSYRSFCIFMVASFFYLQMSVLMLDLGPSLEIRPTSESGRTHVEL